MGVTPSRPGRVDPDLSLPLVSRSAAAPASMGAGLREAPMGNGKQLEYAKANRGVVLNFRGKVESPKNIKKSHGLLTFLY